MSTPTDTQVLDITLIRTQVMETVKQDVDGRFEQQRQQNKALYTHFGDKVQRVEDQLVPMRRDIHELAGLSGALEKVAQAVERIEGKQDAVTKANADFMQAAALKEQAAKTKAVEDELAQYKRGQVIKAGVIAAMLAVAGFLAKYVFKVV